MSVHRGRSGKWETRWREGSRNRSRTFDRKRDAQTFDAEVRRRSQLGGLVPPRAGGKTLDDLIEQDWLPTKLGELAPKTMHEYAAVIDRHISPDLGHLPLTTMRPARLHEWQQARLARGAGRESIARATKLLKQILDQAVKIEAISINPAATLRSPRSSRRNVRPATAFEVEKLRGRFLADQDLGSATLISVLAYVGLRPMEALALRYDDIQGNRVLVERALTNGQFKLTKTSRNRSAYLPKAVSSDLAEWSLATGERRGLIWPRKTDGLPWLQSNWDNWRRRRFSRAALDCELGSLVPYDLRHTAVSLRVSAGRPITEIAEDMGHSAATCASVYSHLISALRDQPVRELDVMIHDARRSLDLEVG